MRTTDITQAEVDAACYTIQQRTGKPPTTAELRNELGRGSYSTIGPLRQHWQDRQPRTAPQVSTLSAPLQKLLQDYVAGEVATAVRAVQTELLTAQQEQAGLVAEAEQLTAELLEARKMLSAIDADSCNLRQLLSTQRHELEQVRVSAEADRQQADRWRIELAKAELRLEAVPRLERQLAEQAEIIARLTDERHVALTEAAVQRATAQSVESQLVDLKSQLQAERQSRRDSPTPAAPKTRTKTQET